MKIRVWYQKRLEVDEDRIDWKPPKNEFYAFLSIVEVEVAEVALRLYVTSRAGRC